MKTNKLRFAKFILFVLSIIAIIILYYYPFETDQQCGESSLCWVKLGVYTYDYNSEDSSTYFGKNIQFGEKVGGLSEYLGLKRVKCNY